MARRLIWLPAAADDLDELAAYIAADSPSYAASLVRRMLERASDLPRFPEMGHVVPELDDPRVRETSILNYRMIYRLDEDAVTILALLHGARRWPDDLARRTT